MTLLCSAFRIQTQLYLCLTPRNPTLPTHYNAVTAQHATPQYLYHNITMPLHHITVPRPHRTTCNATTPLHLHYNIQNKTRLTPRYETSPSQYGTLHHSTFTLQHTKQGSTFHHRTLPLQNKTQLCSALPLLHSTALYSAVTIQNIALPSQLVTRLRVTLPLRNYAMRCHYNTEPYLTVTTRSNALRYIAVTQQYSALPLQYGALPLLHSTSRHRYIYVSKLHFAPIAEDSFTNFTAPHWT